MNDEVVRGIRRVPGLLGLATLGFAALYVLNAPDRARAEGDEAILHVFVSEAATLTPVPNAAVSVSGAAATVSGLTSSEGEVVLEISQVLGELAVGPDGLFRVDITVNAEGFGRTTILNQYYAGPGTSVGVTLSEENRIEDRICIPRAASVFYTACQQTPAAPSSGTGLERPPGSRSGLAPLLLPAIAATIVACLAGVVAYRRSSNPPGRPHA
jgi:hypothetical protein